MHICKNFWLYVFITERAHSPAGDHVNIEKPAENSEYSVFT